MNQCSQADFGAFFHSLGTLLENHRQSLSSVLLSLITSIHLSFFLSSRARLPLVSAQKRPSSFPKASSFAFVVYCFRFPPLLLFFLFLCELHLFDPIAAFERGPASHTLSCGVWVPANIIPHGVKEIQQRRNSDGRQAAIIKITVSVVDPRIEISDFMAIAVGAYIQLP